MVDITTAVFPVAGLGTRFLPATKAIPKEMLVVGDKPLIQYAVEEALECGIERFIFVTSPQKTSIASHFDPHAELEQHLIKKGKHEALQCVRHCILKPGQAIFTYQHQPLGLGHAVCCAIPWVERDKPFAVLLPDDYFQAQPSCLKQMCQAYHDGMMLAVEKIPLMKTPLYGILDVMQDQWQGQSRLVVAKDIVEKPAPQEAPSNVAAMGRYILPPSILPVLQDLKPGVGDEVQLTDAIRHLLQRGEAFYGFLYDGRRFDCGSKEGWLQANATFLDKSYLCKGLEDGLSEKQT